MDQRPAITASAGWTRAELEAYRERRAAEREYMNLFTGHVLNRYHVDGNRTVLVRQHGAGRGGWVITLEFEDGTPPVYRTIYNSVPAAGAQAEAERWAR